MSVVSTGVAHFQIPTAPAAGVSVVSGAANNLTGTAIVLSASTAAIYITGVHVETSAALAATYVLVQLCQGAGGSETSIGQYLVPLTTASTVALGFRPIFPPIKVASTTRLSVKTADSVGSKTYLVTAECIAQSNVVDDGITVGTVNLTNTLTTYTGNTVQTGDAYARVGAAGAGLTALGDTRIANLDATTSSRMATYTQPTGFLAASFPTSVASPTNITAGTITTVTNLTNAPTSGDLTSTMKTSVTTAATAATPTAAAVTGAVGSVTGAVGSVTAAVTLPTIPTNWIAAAGIAASALNGKGDWNIGKTGYTLTQAFPSNFSSLGIAATGHVSNVDTLTTYTGNTVQTGDSFARLGSAGAGLTALGDTRIANLDATVSSRSTYAGGAVASVTGNVAGNVTGSVGSVVGAVGSVTGLTASNLDAAITSRMATYTQPSGFLASTFPTTVASPTNITAGTITTVTNLTNAPTAGDLTATMKASVTTAATAATPTVATVGTVTGSVGSVVGLDPSMLDTSVSSRLSETNYVIPDNNRIRMLHNKLTTR